MNDYGQKLFQKKTDNERNLVITQCGKIWLYSLIAKLKSGIIPIVSVTYQNSSRKLIMIQKILLSSREKSQRTARDVHPGADSRHHLSQQCPFIWLLRRERCRQVQPNKHLQHQTPPHSRIHKYSSRISYLTQTWALHNII